MNKLLPIVLALLCFGLAEEYEDVIHLKDGSVIYGIIIETKPGEYYKIKSGKNIFVYQVKEIEIIRKELVIEEDSVEDSNKDISNKTWSFGLGLAASKSWSLGRFTKDFKVSDKSAIYIYLTPILDAYGLGYSFQKNYNDKGFVFSLSVGSYYNGRAWYTDSGIEFAYQINPKKSNFWSFGVRLLNYQYEQYGSYGVGYYTLSETLIFPVISWDIRF